MENFTINDYMVNQEAAQLARCAFEESQTYSDCDADESLWWMVDGHEWVIYSYKAKLLCALCDTSDGEDFLSDMGDHVFSDFDKHASLLAFGTLLTKAREELAVLQFDQEEA